MRIVLVWLLFFVSATAAEKPIVLFLVGDPEYRTQETVPAWVRAEVEPAGIIARFLIDDPTKPFDQPTLVEELNTADALFLSIKRRALPPVQLDAIRAFAEKKPVLGIRTASHAFDPKKPEPSMATWPTFDRDVFGGWYQNHYGKGSDTLAEAEPKAAEHPILKDLPPPPLRFTSHLYRCRELKPDCTTLLIGTLDGQPTIREPLAWWRGRAGRSAFYTSLGAPEDFQQVAFRRLLLNALQHALQ